MSAFSSLIRSLVASSRFGSDAAFGSAVQERILPLSSLARVLRQRTNRSFKDLIALLTVMPRQSIAVREAVSFPEG
jgi:hypothetical protein